MESKQKAPSARAQAMLAYIGKNNFVLIAGANRMEHFGDAWLLQANPKGGHKWVKLNTATIPRSGHSGGGDSTCLHFFGGQNVHTGQLYNDVGVFDCTSLTMAPVDYASSNVGKVIPMPRNSHTFCFIPSLKKFVLFGGAGAVGELNDLFIYDIDSKAWVKRVAGEGKCWPSAREMHVAHIYTSKADGKAHMILIGGRTNEGISDEVWDYEVEGNEWIKKKSAPVKIAAAGSGILKENYVFLYGGTDGMGFLNDLWLYNILEDSWKKSTPGKLIKDTSGKITSCVGATEEYLLIYGGCGIEQEFANVEIIPTETLGKEFGTTFI